MGYFTVSTELGEEIRETFTCCHCNRIQRIEYGAPIDLCMKCMKRVCARCHEKGNCIPFEKKLGIYEKAMAKALERQESRRSIFQAAGLD